MKNNPGIVYAVLAYTGWGVIPIFWRQLEHVSAVEIVLHRMVWSCLIVVGLIVIMRQWRLFSSALLTQPAVLLRLFFASLLMAGNWGIFIWAVNSGRIVETAMGYFINPLISVLCGVLFFSERLRKVQTLAIMVAALGIGSMIWTYGELPWVSLSLAVSFSLYSVIKKTIVLPATHGMAIETGFLFMPALCYLCYLSWSQQGSFGTEFKTDVLLIFGGLLSLLPLTLFAAAAKRISLTALGMTQYIGPFLQLAIGVFLYQESFGFDRQVAFGLVWLALLIYVVDQLTYQRKTRRLTT